MNKQLWGLALSAALLISSVCSAQTLQRTKNPELSDKLTYNYVYKGQASRMLEEVVEVTDDEIRTTQRVGDRTYQAAVSTRDLSWLRGFDLPTNQAAEWSPAWVWVVFPLEKGRTWSRRMTAAHESFTSEVAYDMKVGGVEKITTPAGDFKAYRISGKETISSRGKKGIGPFYGKASLTYWATSIKGKLVFIKFEYQNSFAEGFTRELLSAELK